MQNGHGSAVLDEMLEPVSRCFELETARAVVKLTADKGFSSGDYAADIIPGDTVFPIDGENATRAVRMRGLAFAAMRPQE